MRSDTWEIAKYEKHEYAVWIAPKMCMTAKAMPNAFWRIMQRLVFGFRWGRFDSSNIENYEQ